MALPSDKLEVVLDQFDTFAVGQCQCRITAEITGHGCGGPKGNCAVMGRWAQRAIEAGCVRQVSKQEMLDIKREAESHGMVNWMMNVAATKSQCFCSCCGCCCHAMRAINEFNAPSMMAPPHFIPRVDAARCTYCGKCARACPMGAITVDLKGKTQRHLEVRMHRLRPVFVGLPTAAGDQHGARPRLQAALQELVCPAQPGRAEYADYLVEGVVEADHR